MTNSVVFAYRHELPGNNQSGNNLPGRPEIFSKLRRRDLDPIVTLHAEDAFTEAGVESITLYGPEERVQALEKFALEEVGVIINRLDRSIKKDLLPNAALLPPMINENETRSLAFHKMRVHSEVLNPLGLAMPTRLINSELDIEEFLDDNSGPSFIVKPDNGTNSKGIIKVSRDDVHGLLNEHPDIAGKHIIQPAYDFTLQFPKDVRPYDSASTDGFEKWNVADQTKEMRIYGFRSPAGIEVFPAARAINNGDQWFFVDPDSLPYKIVEGTAQAISKAAEVSGALALFGTVDYGFGGVGDEEPDWYAIELNARMPYMVGYDKHAGVADVLREHFADQILATAQV